MKTGRTAIGTFALLAFLGTGPWQPWANAERLPKSDLDSTLQPHCDFCWYPTPDEPRSNRLPTYKQQRPRRPPDSRPQRFPKGRYKLAPGQKPSRLSTLRTRSLRNTRLLSTLQISAVDGDTIRAGPNRIRLRGIDTPELNEPGGQAARQRLQQLLQEGPIRIVPHGQDVYGRTIADVFVDGRNVADVLRQEGFTKSQF